MQEAQDEQEARIRQIRGMRKLTPGQFSALLRFLGRLGLDPEVALQPVPGDQRVMLNVQLTPEELRALQLRSLDYGLPASQVARLLVLGSLRGATD